MIIIYLINRIGNNNNSYYNRTIYSRIHLCDIHIMLTQQINKKNTMYVLSVNQIRSKLLMSKYWMVFT